MTKEQFRYNKAIEEIEDILGKIETEDLDVDDLTEKVERVAMLIKMCRDKLHATEQAVEKILDEMKEG
ncbi:MAG: exodeoxyribonuclease VII small subunit [Bacteroidales bacterium]|nr:MAG: exodeoxyribonuclease VII small subunit [Bacteroidales bacterium]